MQCHLHKQGTGWVGCILCLLFAGAHLGATITENNEILAEIKERITAGNKAYYSSHNMLKNKNISRKTKKNIYKTIIRPVVTYGSETWTLTKSAETVLNTWER